MSAQSKHAGQTRAGETAQRLGSHVCKCKQSPYRTGGAHRKPYRRRQTPEESEEARKSDINPPTICSLDFPPRAPLFTSHCLLLAQVKHAFTLYWANKRMSSPGKQAQPKENVTWPSRGSQQEAERDSTTTAESLHHSDVHHLILEQVHLGKTHPLAAISALSNSFLFGAFAPK